jgi:hypothetical protein
MENSEGITSICKFILNDDSLDDADAAFNDDELTEKPSTNVNANSTEIIPANESCHAQEKSYQEKLPKIEELSKTEEDKSPIKLNEEQMDCLNLSIESTNSAFSNSQLDFIATINETTLLEKRIDLAERELEKVIENSQLVKELKKPLNCNLVLEKIEEEKSEHSQASPKTMDIDSIDQANLLSHENQNINLNTYENENVFAPTDSLAMGQNHFQEPSKAVINETFILEKRKDLTDKDLGDSKKEEKSEHSQASSKTMDIDSIDQANLLSHENQNINLNKYEIKTTDSLENGQNHIQEPSKAMINETSLLEKRIDLTDKELLEEDLGDSKKEEKSEHSQASPKTMDTDSIDQANLLSHENQNTNLDKHENENVFAPTDSLVSKAVLNETFIIEKRKNLTMDVDSIDQANLLSNENQKIACSFPKNVNINSKTSAEEKNSISRKSPVKKDVEEGEIDELCLNASKELFQTQKNTNKNFDKNKKNDNFDEYIIKCHEKSTAKNTDKATSSSKEKSIKRKELDDNSKQTIKHQESNKDKTTEYATNNKKSKANEIDNSKTKSDLGGDRNFIQDKNRVRDRKQDRDVDRDRDHNRERERNRDRNHDRDYDRNRNREHNSDRDRDRNRERNSNRDRDRERNSERDRDRERNSERDRNRDNERTRSIEKNPLIKSDQNKNSRNGKLKYLYTSKI